jgi:hypothetical protein
MGSSPIGRANISYNQDPEQKVRVRHRARHADVRPTFAH